MRLTNPFGDTPINALTQENAVMKNAMYSHTPEALLISEPEENRRPIGIGIMGAEYVDIGGKRFIKKSDNGDQLHLLVAEVAAFKLAEAMGFKFVPATYFARDKDWNFYTLQRYVANAQSWDRTEEVDREKIDKTKLTHIYLFDYLIGNTDRHGNNFLVTREHEPVAIDHGYSFQGQDMFGVAYSHYVNPDVTLNEFAYRLSNADTRWIEKSVSRRAWDTFRNHAAFVIRNGFKTFAELKPEL